MIDAMTLTEIVAEAFAAGQERMRNRAAIAAMDIVRAQAAFVHPINLVGNVGKAICDLDVQELPKKQTA